MWQSACDLCSDRDAASYPVCIIALTMPRLRPQLGCLYDSTHSASGPLLMVLFLVLVVLLGLNMLIAIMAKTFDGMCAAAATANTQPTMRLGRAAPLCVAPAVHT